MSRRSPGERESLDSLTTKGVRFLSLRFLSSEDLYETSDGLVLSTTIATEIFMTNIWFRLNQKAKIPQVT